MVQNSGMKSGEKLDGSGGKSPDWRGNGPVSYIPEILRKRFFRQNPGGVGGPPVFFFISGPQCVGSLRWAGLLRAPAQALFGWPGFIVHGSRGIIRKTGGTEWRQRKAHGR